MLKQRSSCADYENPGARLCAPYNWGGQRMGIHLGRVGHIGIHVSDVDRSIEFYRQVLGLKVTGRWGPPDFGRPICFMRIKDKHHDVVLFELSQDAKKAGVSSIDSRNRTAPG